MAAIFCNILGGFHDFEAGNDVILFDDPGNINPAHAVVVNRNQEERHPRTGQPSIMVKYPCRGGFVPVGAKRRDGTLHPHAGTGFSLTEVLAWPVGGEGRYRGPEYYEYLELHQYAFDGRTLRVTNTERVGVDELLSGWRLSGTPMNNAIPDGDNLLLGMAGGKFDRAEQRPGAGVTKWTRGKQGWRPVGYVPVTEPDRSFEPTLIRDVDGALLFVARGDVGAIRIWRSSDGGQTWTKIIHVVGEAAASVISINRAADGTPYIASNLYDVLLHPVAERFRRRKDAQGIIHGAPFGREKLCLWPLNADRTDLETPMLVRDTYAEFGRTPSGDTWNVDHPNALTVQLGDKFWHNLIVMRVCDHGTVSEGDAPAPQSGTYIEEVVSAGEPLPMWVF
jgi:hypothetical protein